MNFEAPKKPDYEYISPAVLDIDEDNNSNDNYEYEDYQYDLHTCDDKAIGLSYLCDGVEDCSDGSDEDPKVCICK